MGGLTPEFGVSGLIPSFNSGFSNIQIDGDRIDKWCLVHGWWFPNNVLLGKFFWAGDGYSTVYHHSPQMCIKKSAIPLSINQWAVHVRSNMLKYGFRIMVQYGGNAFSRFKSAFHALPELVWRNNGNIIYRKPLSWMVKQHVSEIKIR